MDIKGLAKRVLGVITFEQSNAEEKDINPEPSMQEIIAGLRSRYEREVKPHIDSGDYLRANIEFEDIVAYLEIEALKICSSVHSGLGYISAARTLHQKLESATKRPDFEVEYFEAMQAQTKLPYRPGF